jgi:hypothetical protein
MRAVHYILLAVSVYSAFLTGMMTTVYIYSSMNAIVIEK